MAAEIFATGPFILLFAAFLWYFGALSSWCLSLALAFVIAYGIRRATTRRLEPDSRCCVLITGCSSGIGLYAAVQIIKQGATVFACVRNEESKNALIEKLSSPEDRARLIPIFLDVTDQAQINQAATQVKERLQSIGGYLHGVVNNAGYSETSPLELIPLEKLRRQFDVNVVGQVAVSQAFLPLLRQANNTSFSRRLIFISSGLGRFTSPGSTPYCASKHALESISDGFRMELKHWGIDVVCIQPGALSTQFMINRAKNEEMNIAKITEGKDGMAVPDDVLTHYRKCIKAQNEMKVISSNVSYGTDAIAAALFENKPLTRYLAGPDVQLLPLLTKLPDKVMDFLMGRAYSS